MRIGGGLHGLADPSGNRCEGSTGSWAETKRRKGGNRWNGWPILMWGQAKGRGWSLNHRDGGWGIKIPQLRGRVQIASLIDSRGWLQRSSSLRGNVPLARQINEPLVTNRLMSKPWHCADLTRIQLLDRYKGPAPRFKRTEPLRKQVGFVRFQRDQFRTSGPSSTTVFVMDHDW